MTEPMTPEQLDAEVRRYLELTDQIEQLEVARKAIKDRLRDLGPGKYSTSFGVGVSVSPPNRSFNLTRAWETLTPEQQALCLSPDAGKVKGQIPPVLLDEFMEPGKGEGSVAIR